MDKINILIIRACKSKDPITRLGSVYKRFYCSKEVEDEDLIFMLTKCIEECKFKYRLSTLLANIDTETLIRDNLLRESIVYHLLNIIRFTASDVIEDYPTPTRVKRIK